MGRHNARKVESLCRSLQRDAVHARLIADRCEGHMAATAKEHVAMYLVTYYKNILLCTDMRHLLQRFPAPTDAGRVVRIAEYHHLAPLNVLTQTVEVHLKGCRTLPERGHHNLTLVGLGHQMEWMINRFLYENLVPLLRKPEQREEYTRHNTGDIAYLLWAHVKSILMSVPFTDGVEVGLVGAGIAENALLQAALNGVHHKRRRAEIHVSDPHRYDISTSADILEVLQLVTVCALAGNDFIEI